MTLDQINEKIWFYDFEVYAHDWLIVLIEYSSMQRYVYHNDPESLIEFVKSRDMIMVGYNNKHYDQYILKGILSYYEPERIKQINDYIIAEQQQGWSYRYENVIDVPPQIDLMDDIVPRKSLKMLQGAMGLPIVETSIPFDHPTKWKPDEKLDIEKYCVSDVETLIPLWVARTGYLEAKTLVAELGDLDPIKCLNMTNAKLTAEYLGAKPVNFNDERDYKYPENLAKEIIPKEIIAFFDQLHDENVTDDEIFNMKLEIMLLGVKHKFGWGGLHGARPTYVYKANPDDDYIVVNYDFDSYYPHLKIRNNYVSRAMIGGPEFYDNVLSTRLESKKHKDTKNVKINKGLKLILNTAYGAMLEQFNKLYDPLMGRSVCITGQLYLTMLLITLDFHLDLELINTNTDGIMFKIHKSDLETVRGIVNEFVEIVKIPMEEEVVDFIAQKDVNNYVAMINGKLKFKGGYVSDYEPDFASRNMSAVARAIVHYFKDGTDPAETINTCTELLDFQMVQKVGGSYSKVIHETADGVIELQRTNRIYASTDKRLGKIKKVKLDVPIQDKDGNIIAYKDRLDTLQNCPFNAIVDNENKLNISDINKKWYINLAKKRIKDFEGSKSKMDETNIMEVDPTKLKKDELLQRLLATEQNGGVVVKYEGVIGKMHELRKMFQEHEWVKDGYNPQTKSEYVQAAQYKYMLNMFCLALGLEYRVDFINVERGQITTAKGSGMFWGYLEANLKFTDLATGEFTDYTVHVEASDTLDKSLQKCNTLLAKMFIQTQFLISDKSDEFVDTVPVAEKGRFVSKDEQKEIAKTIVEEPTTSTDPQKTHLISLFEKIRTLKKKPTWNDKVYQLLIADKLTSAKTQGFIMQLEEILEELEEGVE